MYRLMYCLYPVICMVGALCLKWCPRQAYCYVINRNTAQCTCVHVQDAVLANAAMRLAAACMHMHGQLPCIRYDMATVCNTWPPYATHDMQHR
jgi:hypothetical protein